MTSFPPFLPGRLCPLHHSRRPHCTTNCKYCELEANACLALQLDCFDLSHVFLFSHLRDHVHVCASLFFSSQELAFPLSFSLCLQERINSRLLDWNGLFRSATSLVALIHLTGFEPIGTGGFAFVACSYHLDNPHRHVPDLALASLAVDLCFYISRGKMLLALAGC